LDPARRVSYREFIAAIMLRRVAVDEPRLVLAFQTMDVESQGYLDKSSVRRAMGSGATDQARSLPPGPLTRLS
jgi:Ca2+-binding EF-hand superfamily protein